MVRRQSIAAWLAGCLLFATAFAAEGKDLANADAWNRALAPLDAMPAQLDGAVRSGFTFGDETLRSLSGQGMLDGLKGLPACLWLMARPQAAAETPLLKVSHPRLVAIFGGHLASLHQWADPALAQRLVLLYQSDNAAWSNPLGELQERAERLQQLERSFAILPRKGAAWLSPSQARESGTSLTTADRAILEQWDGLKAKLAADDPQTAGPVAEALLKAVRQSATDQAIPLPRLGVDLFYQEHRPFAKAAFIYLLAAIGFGAALLLRGPRSNWARRIGCAILAAGLAEEILGVALRWTIAGRAPLSNMFESLTFAVAGLVLTALVFEWIWKTRLAGLGGSILGFIFMVIAHKAPVFDSAIKPLMPALQSVWLTYHVVAIMLSYSAFALSFFAALCYLAKDAFGGDGALGFLGRMPALAALDLFNYRIIAVGFPLLTLGILFGAIWADSAWGRPWGFDPKETWSAITWLIYAIYLHVRYLAGWQGRRASLLALLGFGAVMFTYLGVNFLLPGLHSYA